MTRTIDLSIPLTPEAKREAEVRQLLWENQGNVLTAELIEAVLRLVKPMGSPAQERHLPTPVKSRENGTAQNTASVRGGEPI